MVLGCVTIMDRDSEYITRQGACLAHSGLGSCAGGADTSPKSPGVQGTCQGLQGPCSFRKAPIGYRHPRSAPEIQFGVPSIYGPVSHLQDTLVRH